MSEQQSMENIHKIVVFKNKKIRRTLHNIEWWFVISDVIETLTGSSNPSDYVKKMRNRDNELPKGWGHLVPPFWWKQTAVDKK